MENRAIKLLFLGQCLNYGYNGIERSRTFPEVAMSMLKTRFPGLSFKYAKKYLHHPTGLKPHLRRRLLLTKPDIVILSLPAIFASTPWRVSLLYQIAPEVIETGSAWGRRPLPKTREDAINNELGLGWVQPDDIERARGLFSQHFDELFTETATGFARRGSEDVRELMITWEPDSSRRAI